MGARRGAAAIASPLSAFKKREGDRPSNRRVASADGAVLNCKSPSFSPNSESERDVTLHSIFKQAHSSARVTFFTTPHSQTSQQYHSRGSRQGVRSIERINIPGDLLAARSLFIRFFLPSLNQCTPRVSLAPSRTRALTPPSTWYAESAIIERTTAVLS